MHLTRAKRTLIIILKRSAFIFVTFKLFNYPKYTIWELSNSFISVYKAFITTRSKIFSLKDFRIKYLVTEILYYYICTTEKREENSFFPKRKNLTIGPLVLSKGYFLYFNDVVNYNRDQ